MPMLTQHLVHHLKILLYAIAVRNPLSMVPNNRCGKILSSSVAP
jgi:hypothetical protein